MSTVTIEPLVGNSLRRSPKLYLNPKITPHFSLNYSRKPLSANVTLRFRRRRSTFALRASSTDAAVIETSEKSDVVLTETFLVKRPERVKYLYQIYIFVCISIIKLEIRRFVYRVLYFLLGSSFCACKFIGSMEMRRYFCRN